MTEPNGQDTNVPEKTEELSTEEVQEVFEDVQTSDDEEDDFEDEDDGEFEEDDEDEFDEDNDK